MNALIEEVLPLENYEEESSLTEHGEIVLTTLQNMYDECFESARHLSKDTPVELKRIIEGGEEEEIETVADMHEEMKQKNTKVISGVLG